MREARPVNRQRGDGKAVKRSVKWGDSAVRRALGNLHAAFRWAVKKRIVSTNPFHGIERPGARSRGRLAIITPETHRRILITARPLIRELSICLEATGCRPGELLMATAKDWNDSLGALVYYADDRRLEGEARHKTAGKGKDRRIFFTGEALTVMRSRVAQYPTGPLWRSRKGEARSIETVDKAFRQLGVKLKVPGLSPYSYRHTYATRWLENGGSIDDLAALLGNSPAVIRHHYAHLCDNLDRLRQLAEGFKRGATPAAQTDSQSPDVLPFDGGAREVV
jgi:integrase